jgi:hypothetical protein
MIGLAGSVAVVSAVPILPSADLGRSQAFYVFLGFTVVDTTGEYLRLRLDEAELHLYAAADTDPRTNPGGWYLRAAFPEELREKWVADGLECPDVEVPPCCGPTLFAVIDPDGNMMRVGPLAG